MGFLEEQSLATAPTIPEFYRGKSIFVTGGSGFLGKVLIEKLLYSCSKLDKIFILLRSKKGMSPGERLQKLYSTPCFDRLRQDRPGVFESKVFVLAGDISQAGLGLSPEDRELIIKKVNIVFHVAANVRLADPLPVAVHVNLRSAVEILEIAKEMTNLNALVHVSTAYANSQWNPVEEKIYPPYANWRDILKICDNLDEKTLNILSPKCIGDVANTYIFTKQLAEQAVYEQRGKLPIVITRPSIVMPSLKEPTVGWIENFSSTMGILVGVATGIIRCLYSREDLSADYVPVDNCIQHFIAAAWIRGIKKLDSSDDIEIYNCCSNEKIKNGWLVGFGKDMFSKVPFESSLWTANSTFATSKYWYYFNVLTKHILPALFIDMILWISGKQPMLLNLQRKIFITSVVGQKFMMCEFDFAIKNFIELRSCLKEEDMQYFYYDFKRINSKEYWTNCAMGSKIYLLKEKYENMPKAKAHMKRINLIDKIIRYGVCGAAAWLFINSNIVLRFYHNII